MQTLILIVVGVLVLMSFLAVFGLRGLIYTCSPNEVLIFAGRKRKVGDRQFGFRLMKGGTGVRIPLVERVYRMDLSNMAIDITAANAYSKGGIPLTVQGVANMKVAGHEPLLNNAIERFVGKSRSEIVGIAKATLEGSLRGVLATMTPEQVNEDKLLFAERLVSEVEQDMNNLGLVVDTMKIQNVQDDVKYLESIGRERNADVLKRARVSEAIAQADSIARSAENLEKETAAQIKAEIQIANAQAERQLADIMSRREALIAEERANVAALIAQADSDLAVQRARIELVRKKLEADIVQPAKAKADAAEAQAKAGTAGISADATARAEALTTLAKSFANAGPRAKEILISQKLDSVIKAMADIIPNTHIEKLTLMNLNDTGNGLNPGKLLALNEQAKSLLGIDVLDKLKGFGESAPALTNGRKGSTVELES